MHRYAEVDGCGFIIWIRTFQEPVDAENMIPIDWDFDKEGKRWNGTEWEKYEQESQPLSEQEQIAIDTALNVEYIACLMEANLQQL